MIVKVLSELLDWVSLFVTTTFQIPAGAPFVVRLQVIEFGLLTTTDDVGAGISAWPVFFSETMAPGKNPLPNICTPVVLLPLSCVTGGVILTISGAAV